MNRPAIDGDGGGGIVLDPQTAETVRRRFHDLAAEFENSRTPLNGHYSSMLSACGQFKDALDSGASKFLLSWSDVFDVSSTESGLIAGNVNAFYVDLQALDRDSSSAIQL